MTSVCNVGTIDMDMISTGKTALDRDLITKLAEECKNLLTNSHRGQRLTYANIRQLIVANAGSGNNNINGKNCSF